MKERESSEKEDSPMPEEEGHAGTDQSTHLRGYVHLLPEEIKISFCTKFIIVIFSDPKIYIEKSFSSV